MRTRNLISYHSSSSWTTLVPAGHTLNNKSVLHGLHSNSNLGLAIKDDHPEKDNHFKRFHSKILLSGKTPAAAQFENKKKDMFNPP